MGQAKQRGTREERVAQSIARQKAEYERRIEESKQRHQGPEQIRRTAGMGRSLNKAMLASALASTLGGAMKEIK